MHARQICWLALAITSWGLGLSAQASPPTSEEPKTRAQTLREASAALAGEDVEAMQQAFASLAELGGAEPAQLIVERLRTGLPPLLSEAAMDALAALKQPSCVPALVELCAHFRWQVREKAIATLTALRARTAQSALLQAVDDPNAYVRAAAVRALGEVGDVRVLPVLLAAADKGIEGALVSLGKLGGVKEAEALLVRVKDGDVTPVANALRAMLDRRNFQVAHKLKIIDRVAQLATPSAAQCLAQWSKELGGRDPRLGKALADALSKAGAAESPAEPNTPQIAGARAGGKS